MSSSDDECFLCVFIAQIEYSRAMMNITVDKASYVWTEINKTDDEVAKDLADEDVQTHVHPPSVTI